MAFQQGGNTEVLLKQKYSVICAVDVACIFNILKSE